MWHDSKHHGSSLGRLQWTDSWLRHVWIQNLPYTSSIWRASEHGSLSFSPRVLWFLHLTCCHLSFLPASTCGPCSPVPSALLFWFYLFFLEGLASASGLLPLKWAWQPSLQILKKFLPEYTPATSSPPQLTVPNAHSHAVLPDNPPTSGDATVILPHAQGSSPKPCLKQGKEAPKTADWEALRAGFESLLRSVESFQISKPSSSTTKWEK